MNTITQSEIELSERLRKACLEKGITKPRFVAQDADGDWYHYKHRPVDMHDMWVNGGSCHCLYKCIYKGDYNPDWRDTLMEWNPNAAVPLADILQNTCEQEKIRGTDTPITDRSKRPMDGFADEWVPRYTCEELERQRNELLEALEEMLIESQTVESGNQHTNAKKQARAVLAKAKGETL